MPGAWQRCGVGTLWFLWSRRGFQFLPHELHAAILRVKLKRLDAWNRRRREIAAAYRSAFAEMPFAMQKETGKSNYHLFVIASAERDALRQYLAAQEIPTAIHYPIPMHRQKACLL